jgi:hypothetical protein
MTTSESTILWAGDPHDIWLQSASDIVNEQASEEQIQKSARAYPVIGQGLAAAVINEKLKA